MLLQPWTSRTNMAQIFLMTSNLREFRVSFWLSLLTLDEPFRLLYPEGIPPPQDPEGKWLLGVLSPSDSAKSTPVSLENPTRPRRDRRDNLQGPFFWPDDHSDGFRPPGVSCLPVGRVGRSRYQFRPLTS